MTEENGIGHNQPDKQGERESLFLKHLRPILTQKAKCDDERGILNVLRHLAKDDGFSLKLMDEAVRIYNNDDKDAVTKEIEDRIQMAFWLGLPVGMQLSMFEPKDQESRKGEAAADIDTGSNPASAPSSAAAAKDAAGK